MSSKFTRVSVVIPNWNTERWLPGCLDGLRKQKYRNFQTILVDNGSTDNSVLFVKENFPEVKIVAFSDNRGFAAAVNAGVNGCNSKYVALLNVDTVPHPEWLLKLVEVIEQSLPDVGSLASKMISLDDPSVLDDAGNTFSWYGSANKRGKGEPVDAYSEMEEVFSACAGAALYRRSFFEDVGNFDENFVSYLEDIDLGLRGQLSGYRCLYVPSAKVLHQWSGARIPRPKYVHYSTRNRLMVLLKNIPALLLVRHIFTLLYGQFYFFLVYKKPGHSLKGYISFLTCLPRVLRQRKIIQNRKKISNQTLNALLSNQLGEPSLTEIIKAKFRR